MDRARRGRPRSLRRCPSPFHLFSCQSRCIMRFRAQMHGFTGRKAQAQGRVAADAYGDSAKSYFLGCDASVAVKAAMYNAVTCSSACVAPAGLPAGTRTNPWQESRPWNLQRFVCDSHTYNGFYADRHRDSRTTVPSIPAGRRTRRQLPRVWPGGRAGLLRQLPARLSPRLL